MHRPLPADRIDRLSGSLFVDLPGLLCDLERDAINLLICRSILVVWSPSFSVSRASLLRAR